MSSMETFYPVKRIVRRKVGSDKPFLIEWETVEPCDFSWEPWENLSDKYKSKFCKNGKVRKAFRKEKRKENVSLNKPKRKRSTAFPPVPKSAVERAEENEAIIPAKRPCGTIEYSEYQNPSGDAVLVVKKFHADRVEYQHYNLISRTMSDFNERSIPL